MKRSLLLIVFILSSAGIAQAQVEKNYSFTIPEYTAFDQFNETVCDAQSDPKQEESSVVNCKNELHYITNKTGREVTAQISGATIRTLGGAEIPTSTAWDDVSLTIGASNIQAIAKHPQGNAGTAYTGKVLTATNEVTIIGGISRVLASADVNLKFTVNQFAEPSVRYFTVYYTITP